MNILLSTCNINSQAPWRAAVHTLTYLYFKVKQNTLAPG